MKDLNDEGRVISPLGNALLISVFKPNHLSLSVMLPVVRLQFVPEFNLKPQVFLLKLDVLGRIYNRFLGC